MPVNHRFEIQVSAYRACCEFDCCLMVSAIKQNAVAQDSIAQCQRRLVEDRHVHIIDLQYFLQPSGDLQPRFEAFMLVALTRQQYTYIHIGKRSSLAARE